MISLSGSLENSLGNWLFRDIAVELVPGGWTCLLGPSGVGKTTILRLLAGLETHGNFSGNLGDSGTLPACAYMAQQDLLLPWLNVMDNVCLGAQLRGETTDKARARELITQVGLSDHATKLPSQLSGGMRQRTALARTLMEDRELVLLDEPFSALDARTRAEMQELAHALLAGKTVLLVTHDPGEAARIGDKNLIIDEDGLRAVEHKPGRDIAPADAESTLQLQAALLRELRGANS